MQRLRLLIVATLLASGFLSLPQTARALSTQEATALVQERLSQTEIAEAKHYCTKGTMTCRTMYQMRDKVTKAPVDFFYDTFYSADRQVGSTCYFVPYVKDGVRYYYQASDTVFDGQVAIDMIGTERAQIQSKAGVTTFSGLYFKKLGTTKYRLGDMVQTKELVSVTGDMYDLNDPAYREAAPKVEYSRIQP